jgi:PAS domain S-box-containing protein
LLKHHPLLLFLILVLAASQASARGFHFETITEQDGLPSSIVYSICQDQQGRMLFATRNGTVAFDGVDWEPLDPYPDNKNKIAVLLARDNRGTIWAASGGKEVILSRQEEGAWKTMGKVSLPSSRYLLRGFCVQVDPRGNTIAAVAGKAGFLQVWDGQQWLRIGGGKTFRNIHKMMFREGRLLIASRGGFFSLDLSTWKLGPTPWPGIEGKHIQTMAAASDTADLMLVGDGWIGRVRDGQVELLAEDLSIPLPQPEWEIYSLVDRAGDLVFGNWSRTYAFNTTRRSFSPIEHDRKGIHKGSLGLFEDREGHIWFAGTRGTEMLPSRRFINFDELDGLLDGEVSAILPLPDGQVILGHEGGLTLMGDQMKTLPFNGPQNQRSRVFDLTIGPGGAVWMAADQLGVGRLNPDHSFTWLDIGEARGQDIYALHFDSTDQLWAGSSSGVFRSENGKLVKVLMPGQDPEASYLVRRIVPGPQGEVLVVTLPNGVFRYRDGEWDHWVKVRMKNLSIYTLAVVGGEYWLATSRGMHRLNPEGELEPLTEPGPVVTRPVYAFLADGLGRQWFGTDGGVLMWDGHTLNHYNILDGLLGTDINRDALQLGPGGRVWIGNERGLSIYSPHQDLRPSASPMLVFDGFEVDGVLNPAGTALELSRPPSTLIAHFRGISFADQRGLSISTWLEGLEGQWQRPIAWGTREARYHDLPPGRYRIHVRANTHEEGPGQEIVSPLLTVAKPFWARWWFLALATLGAATALYLAFHWLSSRRTTRILETQVESRTKALAASEAAARTESERFIATLYSVSEGVLTLDQERRVVLCNPAAETILHCPSEDLLGRNLQELLGVSSAELESMAEPFAVQSPDGRQIWLEGNATPVRVTEDAPTGLVVVLRDITEKRKQESEQARTQKLESLGVLAGGLAHDFNNLLMVIMGNLELTGDLDDLPEGATRFLDTSRIAATKARSLTQQLLTFSKGGSPQLRTISLAEVINNATLLSFRGTIHTFDADVPDDLWPVWADVDQMTQVFNNLFLNACQAMPQGGQVTITARNEENPPGEEGAPPCIRVEVKDSGVGITPEDLARIFDPYFTTKETGSGLGLATVYSIMQKHKGNLTVQSAPGQGSSFILRLPRSLGQPLAERNPEAWGIKPGQRILIMDDEEGIREIMTLFLGTVGLETVETRNGEEAVAAYLEARQQNRPFGAALFDLTIPGGMGGREAANHIRQLDPEFPVAVVSGYSRDPVLAHYRDFGFAAARPKPFIKNDLLAMVSKLLVEEPTGSAPW